ncbi:MAG: hypothetical protein E4H26_05980 [Flavobacteriales bacterium]|nr:MAG: hypothetical protein E4H26_05980 [Flavobacteriales bacterium]
MNISLLIISIILVTSVFLPFFLIDLSGKTAAGQRKKQFKLAIAKNNLTLSDKEIWGNSFIGIDRNQKKLLFMKVEGADQIDTLIDLSNLRDCKIVTAYRKSKVKNQNELLLLKLDLEIHFIKGRNVESLNFFDFEAPYKEDFELIRAEKWKAIINAHATKLQSPVIAA